MSLALDIFGLASWVSFAVALALTGAIRRLAATEAVERFVLPMALATAFFSGYLVLPRDWAPLMSASMQRRVLLLSPGWVTATSDPPWCWLPYLGTIAAAGGATKQATIRWLILAALAILFASVLAPSWPVFGLPRLAVAPLIGFYALSLLLLLEALPRGLLGTNFSGVAAIVAIALAVAIGIFLSLRMAQLAAISAGSFAGLWIGCVIPSSGRPTSLRAIVPFYVALIGGLATIACVEPDPPLPAILLVPLAPLALWAIVVVPRRKH